MVPEGGLNEPSRVVIDAGLTELIGQLQLTILCGVDEEASAILVRLCGHRILLFQQQAHNPDVDTKFLFVLCKSEGNQRVVSEGSSSRCYNAD